MDPTIPNRRQFVQMAALSAVTVSATSALTAEQSQPFIPPGFKPGEMRLASVSWNFGGIVNAWPCDEAIDAVGSLGFSGIELIVGEPKDIVDYWSKESVISGLKKKLDSHKMAVSQFVLFQSAVENLSSLNPDDRNQSLDVFEEGCKAAQKLGASFVNIVAPWPREIRGPQGYLPRYFAEIRPNRKYHMDIAPGFNFAEVWETFVATVKECVSRAQHYGLRFSLENHTHTLVHDSTAFLHLWNQVQSPALGMNLDIGWIQLQREYPPTAIHKVKDRMVNCHLRDIDSEGLVFVGIGEGVMDFKAVIETLKDVGFTGYLAFEQDGVQDMRATLANGKKLIEELMG